MAIPTLDDARRSVRRVVLPRRRLLSALLLGVAVLAALRSVAPAPPPTVPVLVASRDLPAGEVLTDADLTLVALPGDAVPDGMAQESYAVGRAVTGPVRRGEPLTEARLVGESLLEGYAGLVAVPVRLPDAAVAGLLRAGDRIDLLATDPRTGDTLEVGNELPVIVIPRKDASMQGNQGGGRLIVVGTTPEMSTDVTSASATMYLSAVISR
jgi:Flp pilus assembly protein CpaB